MAVLDIVTYPDKFLKEPTRPVEAVDDEIRRIVADMADTMYAAPGIGLAAPQIGVLARVVVMDCAKGEDEEPEPVCLANPEIVWSSDELSEHEEGCLSIPEIYAKVTRPAAVAVRYLDRDGKLRESEFGGLRAVCIQHEIDHLNGKLFIDYLSAMRRQMITTKMKKLKRERARDRAAAE